MDRGGGTPRILPRADPRPSPGRDIVSSRLPLVPAVMTLLGRAAWWIPGPLDRILPHLDAEGSAEPVEPAGKM